MEAQRTRMQEQLAYRRATLNRVARMADQGFARGDKVFDEEVKISSLEERMATSTLAIAKMEVALATAQQDLNTLVLSRRAEIDTELLGLASEGDPPALPGRQ